MNRKIIVGLIALILSLPASVRAETLVVGKTEIQAKIAALLSEVSILQDKLSTTKATEESNQIFLLINSLAKGTRSDEVKTLQTLLAKNSRIYPEGYITGYYGVLTSAAVERFKNAHAVPSIFVESISTPRIFGIAATNTPTTMTIVWKTDVPTSAKIWWGSPGPLDSERMTPVSTFALSKDHSAKFVGGIFSSTTYAFIIAVSDADGNTSTTTEQIYLTPSSL